MKKGSPMRPSKSTGSTPPINSPSHCWPLAGSLRRPISPRFCSINCLLSRLTQAAGLRITIPMAGPSALPMSKRAVSPYWRSRLGSLPRNERNAFDSESPRNPATWGVRKPRDPAERCGPEGCYFSFSSSISASTEAVNCSGNVLLLTVPLNDPLPVTPRNFPVPPVILK